MSQVIKLYLLGIPSLGRLQEGLPGATGAEENNLACIISG